MARFALGLRILFALLAITPAAAIAQPWQMAPMSSPSVQPQPAAPSSAKNVQISERLFATASQSIVQILVLDRVTGEKSTIGSGFGIDPHGRFATNFHVISRAALHPAHYEIRCRHANGTEANAVLEAIDVVSDLAIVRSKYIPLARDSEATNFLSMSESVPAIGASIFALGNPHDLGITIVSGSYSGFREASLYQKIHFTGALNPGMSGGPAIDEEGKVVGINVATGGNSIGFLVPVKQLQTLVARLQPADVPLQISDQHWLTEVGDQLRRNQDAYLDDVDLQGSTSLGPFAVPAEIAPWITCWGDTEIIPDARYRKTIKLCSSDDDIFVDEDLRTGSIEIRHELFTNTGLPETGFYRFLSAHMSQPHIDLGGDERYYEDYVCTNGAVDGTRDAPADTQTRGWVIKTVLCARTYLRFPGLVDFVAIMQSPVVDDEGIYTILEIRGATLAKASSFWQAFASNYTIDEMWTNARDRKQP